MSIYTNTARFDGSARALTEDELYAAAPSIFATEAHVSRSDKFRPIPTIQVLRALTQEGFHPVGVKQSRTRVPGRAEFTKHLIRMRRLDDRQHPSQPLQVGDNVLEILLKNANDGSSKYDIMAGLFRIRCLNSLVSQSQELDSLKVRHTGNPEDVARNVIEGTYSVLETAKGLLQAPEEWGAIQLNKETQMAYATAAHQLRFGDADGNVDTPIEPRQMLFPRRAVDMQNDLWTTFNVVQENALKGGLHNIKADSTVRGGYRKVSTRAVNGIDQDIRLNKALWTLTAEMARLAA